MSEMVSKNCVWVKTFWVENKPDKLKIVGNLIKNVQTTPNGQHPDCKN